MAKINISLDAKSINNAIKQVESIKTKMATTIPSLFITKCLQWVMNRANEYLSTISMDGEVIADIQSNWTIERVTNNVKRLVNSSNKAVFVEFGVGRVGQISSHPQANIEGYQYNKPSEYKKSDGSWIFDAQHKQYAIDLKEGYYVMIGDENNGRAKVMTKGSPANLYLYNAGMDLISTGAYKILWQQALNETI